MPQLFLLLFSSLQVEEPFNFRLRHGGLLSRLRSFELAINLFKLFLGEFEIRLSPQVIRIGRDIFVFLAFGFRSSRKLALITSTLCVSMRSLRSASTFCFLPSPPALAERAFLGGFGLAGFSSAFSFARCVLCG